MKVAIVGNIAGVANETLVALRKAGIEADLFIRHKERDVTADALNAHSDFNSEWVRYIDPKLWRGESFVAKAIWAIKRFFYQPGVVFRLLTQYDLIHSNTGSLNFCFLSRLFFIRLKLKPYLAFATGSDIREVAQLYPGLKGKRMRAFFRNARGVFLLNVDMLSFKDDMGLHSARFFPFMINEEKFAPAGDIKKPGIYGTKLLCFMMSSLDFGYTDNGPYRRAIKHNEYFFHALAEFVKTDKDIIAIVLDRGPDKDVARKMVADLRLNNHVQFLPPMSEAQRIEYVKMADVIIDQFDPGSFGLGAIETLSLGKPLITYFREDLIPESYRDIPPILNARTVEDILKRLMQVRDPGLQKSISGNARQWSLKHHSRGVVIPELIQLYRSALD
jgi:glycosyltransferase involved in cell wall biosynthesis